MYSVNATALMLDSTLAEFHGKNDTGFEQKMAPHLINVPPFGPFSQQFFEFGQSLFTPTTIQNELILLIL